ncbi:hypothetical protein K438DRAFT_1994152 [Mycena galopus ATCC 62051]|nr:hypothetical protein K438DRAFT_1994152 [Mycena galopus ATCC 62051]
MCVHLPESPAKGKPGPNVATAMMADAIRWYRDVPVAHWPIGMCSSPTSTAPLTTDIAAWLTLNALAPMRGELTALDHNTFLWKAILIFSISGYFDHYVTLGQYPPDDLPLEHYPFDTISLRWSHIVSWITQHGILKGSEATWSVISSIADGISPHIDLTTLGTDDVWSSLQHGVIREGVDTFYPIFPAYTIDLSEIAPGPPTHQRHPRPILRDSSIGLARSPGEGGC